MIPKKLFSLAILLLLAIGTKAQSNKKCYYSEVTNNGTVQKTTVTVEITGENVKATIKKENTNSGKTNTETNSKTGKVIGSNYVFAAPQLSPAAKAKMQSMGMSVQTADETWQLNSTLLTIGDKTYNETTCQ